MCNVYAHTISFACMQHECIKIEILITYEMPTCIHKINNYVWQFTNDWHI